MFDARRPKGRLFYLLLIAAAMPAAAQAPPTTTVADVVYRADGTPAGGTLLISWPTFTTAASQAIAAGSKSVTLGPGGALSVALVPNSGGTPATALYTVVYHVDDGTVKTEYWIVPSSSPTTLGAVRTTPGTGSGAASLASRQYVDTSVAAKANDSNVVHKSGSESIGGVKQFSLAPTAPTPAQPTEVANKAYVDSAVTTVGAGVFISKAGDAMAGPLTLAADPTAPTQASTRHYVDTGLAAKADVAGGVVPTAQLGSGTATGTVCLKGNSTWGPCADSANAVSLQSTPIDTAAPTDNQVITYEASSGKYKPKAGGGVTAGMQAVKYANDFSWSKSPADDLSTAGSKTVNLAACPPGVKGSESQYYVYISGTGTAEAVLVTGGTCAGDGVAGTLQFTTANAHSAGYTITSASSGFQEALIGARITPTNPTTTPQSGNVVVPPGEFKAYARISIRSSNVTVDLSGSIIECWMDDTCIFVGDPSNANLYSNITLINPRGRPTVTNGTAPFIEVNAQKTRLYNVELRSGVSSGKFGNYVKVDGDQAFLLDGIDISSGGYTTLRCDSTVCNPAIYAPGPFGTNPAVGWLKNMNLSLQCNGNGIDWHGGNTLHISDSVVQGYSQYGIRIYKAGGFGSTQLDDVYQEVGSCTNPVGNIGVAGLISEGEPVTITNTWNGKNPGPAGKMPTIFANTGSTDYRYYVVVKDSTYGAFAAATPLYIGNAASNGSGNITVTWPCVAGTGTVTYDLLRITWVNGQENPAPYGTGNWAVATAIAQGGGAVCTATDTNAALSSYAVANPGWFPKLDHWPGSIILTTDANTQTPGNVARVTMNEYGGGVTSVFGNSSPSVFAHKCYPWNYYMPVWVSCLVGDSVGSNFSRVGATVLQSGPNPPNGIATPNWKGRLNFLLETGMGPHDVITLADSNFAKTLATPNYRPTWDANDSAIGFDQSNGAISTFRLGFRAPVAISNYIGAVFDGSSWLERLTSTLKEFKTNVQADAALTVAGQVSANTYATTTNCANSGGTCGSAAAGRASIAAAATTVTVATTAVTANSEIFIQEDATLGTALSVTCNTTTGRTYTVTTRTAGTSFVVTASAAPTTNPACLSYRIVN